MLSNTNINSDAFQLSSFYFEFTKQKAILQSFLQVVSKMVHGDMAIG